MADRVREIDVEALDALIHRLHEAKTYELVLSAADIELLVSALATLTFLQTRLSDNDVTIHKLRKLLGMINASEKLSALMDTPDALASGGEKPKKRKKPTREGKTTRRRPVNVEHHALESLTKGDRCPACATGTLSKAEPAVLLRVSGHSPYEAVKHILERLRCNACGEYFTAPLPEAVRTDGEARQKYGYSARSLMAINKYYLGAPFYRQETLQDLLNMPITASTVFDQCEQLANSLHPVHNVALALAANAVHVHLDDTPHRIIDQKEIIKVQRRTQQPQRRTGTYASGVMARLETGQEVVLFQTNIGHAGEWIDEILKKRDPGRAPPIIMSDALASNHPTAPAVISLCNSHGRRQFVDVLAHFPDDVHTVLEWYKAIWHHEDEVVERQLCPPVRLAYHREHSLPLMRTIHAWGERQLAEGVVEANSGLGKAIRYFLNHFEGLTCFCTVEGARLDNNAMEATLKLIVRGRKNFSFYRTLAGAAISDVITSMIATCVRAQINPFDYFNALQRHQTRVSASPQDWLPWNYHHQC